MFGQAAKREATAAAAAADTAADAAAGADAETAAGRGCCPLYHEAVELVGRRWTGAILDVLLQADEPLRFTELSQAVPPVSDRMLSERLRELEDRGVVTRHVEPGPPVKVCYELTPMGRGLQPALQELKTWAQHWLD